MKLIVLFFIIPFGVLGQIDYQSDFNKFLDDFEQYFGYLEEQNISIKSIRALYEPRIDTIKTKKEFISLLEEVTYEFHNGHISLNVNLSNSNRIIPSGSDIYVKKEENNYYISDLRKGFPAEQSGLKMGMQIIKFNDHDVANAIKKFLPKSVNLYTDQMYTYAVNMLLAGARNTERKITVLINNKEENFFPDTFDRPKPNELLEYKKIESSIGYIKINNTLGNPELISAFDQALDSLMSVKTLILDLTETPSGGNTMVARGIMGRFANKELPYQVHAYEEKPHKTIRKWIELVSPRGKRYEGNLLVLVGHWTGSIGEGIAIGFDAMKRGAVIGTKMAGLLGAIYIYKMPDSKIGYAIPVEKMYHVNGTPREQYRPKYITNSNKETFLKALELAKKMTH